MTTRKVIAWFLIGFCVFLLLSQSPLMWAFTQGIEPGSIPTTGLRAVGSFLFLFGIAVLCLSPIWMTGLWLLLTARREKTLKATIAKPAEDEPGVWPPPPTRPGT